MNIGLLVLRLTVGFTLAATGDSKPVVIENSVQAENAKISSACRQLSAGETDRGIRAAAMQRRAESQSVECREKSGLGS